MTHAQRATVRWLFGPAALCLLLGVAGCIKVGATLDLNADGSGALKIRYELVETAMARMDAARNLTRRLESSAVNSNAVAVAATNAIPLLFDEKKIRDAVAPWADRGVRIKSLKVESQREWQTVQMDLAFPDLRSVFDLPFFRTCAIALQKTEQGDYRLSLQGPPLGREGDMPEMSDTAIQRDLMSLLAGLNVAVTVNTPSPIVATTASRPGTRSASWTFDLERDGQALQKLNRQPLTVTFSGIGMNLPEFTHRASP